jgi:hypothetical protein
MSFTARAATVAIAAAVATVAQAAIPRELILAGDGRFGDVKFTHAEHFGRVERCAVCHGPGRVGRIEAVHGTMKDAHGFCVSCHEQRAAGPTVSCRGCHLEVRPVRPPATPAAPPTADAR